MTPRFFPHWISSMFRSLGSVASQNASLRAIVPPAVRRALSCAATRAGGMAVPLKSRLTLAPYSWVRGGGLAAGGAGAAAGAAGRRIGQRQIAR